MNNPQPHRAKAATAFALVHVAAASEGHGRVVLALQSAKPNALAVDTAVKIAALYDARIEAVFVENPDLFAAAAHGFSTEISHAGRKQAPLDAERLSAQCHAMAKSAFAVVGAVAAQRNVTVLTRRARDDVDRVLARACTETGPWNIVVLSGTEETPGAETQTILDVGGGATAILTCGRRAKLQNGPILVVLRDADRLAGMMRAARRLSEIDGGTPTNPILAIATDEAEDSALEGLVRLALADTAPQSTPHIISTNAAELADLAQRVTPRLIITHAHSDERDQDSNAAQTQAPWLQDAPCPVVLVR